MTFTLLSDFGAEALDDFYLIELQETSEIEAFVALLKVNPQWHKRFCLVAQDDNQDHLIVLFNDENCWRACLQQMPLAVRRMDNIAFQAREDIVSKLFMNPPFSVESQQSRSKRAQPHLRMVKS